VNIKVVSTTCFSTSGSS